MGGRAGPGPRRVYDEPEDVEFVKVMKGHARQVTTLAVDHGSSQARARARPPRPMRRRRLTRRAA